MTRNNNNLDNVPHSPLDQDQRSAKTGASAPLTEPELAQALASVVRSHRFPAVRHIRMNRDKDGFLMEFDDESEFHVLVTQIQRAS